MNLQPRLPWPTDGDAAGASARRHHRALTARSSADEQDNEDPIPLANLLGPLRPIESAAAARWRRGAEGEELTAALLAPIRYLGWVVLHDLRVPGSAANVDHLVIGPSRVWLIDSKAWRGRVKVLGDGRLWYGRTCLDDSLAVVRWTAQSVGRVLTTRSPSDALVVQPIVCVHGARLPLSPFSWDGVVLVEPGNLVELLTSADSLFPGSRMKAAGGQGRRPTAPRR